MRTFCQISGLSAWPRAAGYGPGMGEMIEFPSNGSSAPWATWPRLLRVGPGVIVIQEWWGLVDHIKDVCDRFAAAGFIGPGPGPLPRGHDGRARRGGQSDDGSADGSGRPGHERRRGRAGPPQSGHPHVGRHRFLHGRRPGHRAGHPASRRRGGRGALLRRHPLARCPARLLGHDGRRCWVTTPARTTSSRPRRRTRLGRSCARLGKEAEIFIYPNADHAFFNDTRPEVYAPEEAALVWERSLAFLAAHLS